MPKVVSFLSIAEDILLIKSTKANAVEWLLRNPNCFEYKILCKFKKLISQYVVYDFFKEFRKGWKNWYWPVITKKCWVICLKNWNHFGYFERFRKHTSRQRSVYNGYKRLCNILERLMNYLDHDRSNFKHNKILDKMAYGLVSVQGWPDKHGTAAGWPRPLNSSGHLIQVTKKYSICMTAQIGPLKTGR